MKSRFFHNVVLGPQSWYFRCPNSSAIILLRFGFVRYRRKFILSLYRRLTDGKNHNQNYHRIDFQRLSSNPSILIHSLLCCHRMFHDRTFNVERFISIFLSHSRMFDVVNTSIRDFITDWYKVPNHDISAIYSVVLKVVEYFASSIIFFEY